MLLHSPKEFTLRSGFSCRSALQVQFPRRKPLSPVNIYMKTTVSFLYLQNTTPRSALGRQGDRNVYEKGSRLHLKFWKAAGTKVGRPGGSPTLRTDANPRPALQASAPTAPHLLRGAPAPPCSGTQHKGKRTDSRGMWGAVVGFTREET